jgi:REP element-mobilizing transposase RayT
MRQAELPLHRGTWGGKRPNAGRKPGLNPRQRHRGRPPLAARFPCHVTIKVRPDVPSLRTVKLVREFEESISRTSERGEFRLVHYSLQPNHAHFLVEAKDRHALGRGMKSLGSRLSRAVNRVFGRRGPVLADRYHLHILKTPREVRAALAYVLLNARRHAKKALRAVRLDPASSARWFDGWRGRRSEPERATPVAQAHTWLLRAGWRRHGLLDPAEIPGLRS